MAAKGEGVYWQTRWMWLCTDLAVVAGLLWRGGLPPLGREAAPPFLQIHHITWIYDRFAAERGQAPSPQKPAHQKPHATGHHLWTR